MRRGRIVVEIEAGMFETERSVSFRGVDQVYQLVVDLADVADGKLEVGILGESNGTVLVALPRDTFTSGSTVRVPRAVVELE